MSSLLHRFPRIRALFTRAGSLLVLFQRAPLIKMLFPEAQFLTSAGLNQVTAWTVTTIAGLGAYDTVAGATTISQVVPTQGAPTVNTAVGSNLVFVYLLTGSPFNNQAGSWTTSTLPAGLVETTVAGNPPTSDSITGIPTKEGSTVVTVTVMDKINPTVFHPSQNFTIVVGPAIITTPPASTSIASGAKASLSVTASEGNGSALSYIWYQGQSGDETHPVTPAATASTFQTPALTATTSYWVKVTRKVGTANVVAKSPTATVSIQAADPFAAWKSSIFSAQQLADATISGDDADPDHDGLTNRQEYLLGTSPLTADTGMLAATRPVSDISLSFVAKAATGPGYDGETRHYALQSSDSLATDAWTPVTGFEDITGTGQTVTFTTPPSAAHAFYRLAVTLTP